MIGQTVQFTFTVPICIHCMIWSYLQVNYLVAPNFQTSPTGRRERESKRRERERE